MKALLGKISRFSENIHILNIGCVKDSQCKDGGYVSSDEYSLVADNDLLLVSGIPSSSSFCKNCVALALRDLSSG